MYVDLDMSSSMIRTKLTLIIKDCNGFDLFRSVEGDSKSKSYKEAYHEAIRESFEAFKKLEYNYTPRVNQDETVKANYENDIKEVQEEKSNAAATSAVVVQVAAGD